MSIGSIFLAGFVILAIIVSFRWLRSWIEDSKAANSDAEEEKDNVFFPLC